MPFFLYFSFTPNYGLKWSQLDVFPAESAPSLENRAKNQIYVWGFFSKMSLNYTFISIHDC